MKCNNLFKAAFRCQNWKECKIPAIDPVKLFPRLSSTSDEHAQYLQEFNPLPGPSCSSLHTAKEDTLLATNKLQERPTTTYAPS